MLKNLSQKSAKSANDWQSKVTIFLTQTIHNHENIKTQSFDF